MLGKNREHTPMRTMSRAMVGLVVVVMLTLAVTGTASARNPYMPSMEPLAKSIALSLDEPAMRAAIERLMTSPEAESGIDILALPDSVLLDRLPDDALRSASRLMESVSLELMIPASAHQAALRGGAPIELVAVGPFWQQEDDVERLIAFDRWGHRIWLDPTIPPDAVTLVLSASEKTSASDCEGSELYHAVPAMTPEGVSLDAHGDRMMYIWLTQMRVFDDMEPWWKGEPELYMLYGRDRETAHRFDLSAKQNAAHDLNHEDLWYCIDAPLCAWYGEKDDEAIGFWIMEADWGREVSADLCTGSDGQWLDTCASAVIGDLDDSLGSASVEMGDLREGTVSACDGERWARYTIPFKLTGAAEFCLADRPMGAQEGAE